MIVVGGKEKRKQQKGMGAFGEEKEKTVGKGKMRCLPQFLTGPMLLYL